MKIHYLPPKKAKAGNQKMHDAAIHRVVIGDVIKWNADIAKKYAQGIKMIRERGNVGSHGTIDKYYSDGRIMLTNLQLSLEDAFTQDGRDFVRFVENDVKKGSNDIMTIAGMSVPKQYRRQGLLNRLLKKALEIAKSKGAKVAVIFLENPELGNVVHKAGWKWIDSIDSANNNTEVYVKYLNQKEK